MMIHSWSDAVFYLMIAPFAVYVSALLVIGTGFADWAMKTERRMWKVFWLLLVLFVIGLTIYPLLNHD